MTTNEKKVVKRNSSSSSPTSKSLSNKKPTMESALQQLKQYSNIVADTGEFSLLSKYNPEDATTNPSLIYKASQLKEYEHLVTEVIDTWKKNNNNKPIHNEKELIETLYDRIIINFGCEILKHIKGRVSTEVDARYSFDTNATVKRARNIIKYYEEKGIEKNRILIKIASTWEGIEACKILEKEGIHCNMTLIFGLPQALLAAEAKATLISPFVGRILDWYKSHDKEYASKEYDAKTDPGVLSVKEIYYYYKKFGYNTTVMGASFRNSQEILELTGCDRLTISPQLLEELNNMKTVTLECKLKKSEANEKCTVKEKKHYNESLWRYEMNENQMATEKLSEGIRGFVSDADKLAAIIKIKLHQSTKKK